MFTLSSEIEWSLPGVVTDSIERKSTSSFLVASLHRFPHESRLATAYCAYFTSYLICDLGLGMAYYRDFIDPLSGWAHHLFYLGVMSRAASQGSISTFFAIGTPIEVSTIFLATGHIFPTLRSDILFATSFFLARIVYPIALLPELYLNVESRLCWKIGALAFLVHIYWFHKVIQQQTRYYHARQEQKQQQCIADFSVKSNMTVQAAEAIEKKTDSETIPNVDTIKKSSIIYEHEPTTVPMAKPLEENTPESPKNEMCGMELPSANQIQVNSSRHRRPRVVRLSSGQSISSLTFFEKADDETVDAPTTITADIPLPAITISTDTTPAPTPIPTSTTIAQAAASKGAKTMKQLLEECSDEDITIYKFPIHNNKTFSALTRKPSNGSHGPLSGDQGVIRLSRASSMRDSKRRIALGAVQFACPSIDEPKEAKELTNQGVAETKGSIRKKVEKNVDMDATVVMRPRRTSPPRDGDYGFGTIRVSRGGIVAVNA
ncbi:hypothetical protein FBU30_003405 [Linnemannia zychae]|nr:hypothetical protein FBU30_003405 [Linnemannia zychae]